MFFKAYNFGWSVVANSIPEILHGLLVTIELSVVVIVLSMVLAVPIALFRMSQIDVLRWATQGYIEIFRCTPLLVQLFWIFYALPALTGVTLSGLMSAVIALTLNLTAFLAEAYRSGFQSVPVEQVEAAKMLRLSRFQQVRYIIVPQAMRQQIPVILSLDIGLFKDTALVSTIAVADLMYVANQIAAQSYRSLEMYTTAAIIYFVIAFPVSIITSSIERRMMSGQPPKARRRVLAGLIPGSRVRVSA